MPLRRSVELRCDPNQRRFARKTKSVARLALDVGVLAQGKPVHVALDGQAAIEIAFPTHGTTVWLERAGDMSRAASVPKSALKTAARSGPFKQAFANHMIFVYGPNGTDEENRATYAKARYDAESWWYRANGSVDVLADTEFLAGDFAGHNVTLYGNSDTNAAWDALTNSPIDVRRGFLKVTEHEERGEDLACVFVYPRAGSDKALVGVVSGTGPNGMRLTNRLAYFASGVAFPDWCVLGPEVVQRGITSARGAGFFANDRTVSKTDSAWRGALEPRIDADERR